MVPKLEHEKNPNLEPHSDLYIEGYGYLVASGPNWTIDAPKRLEKLAEKYDYQIKPGQHDDIAAFMGAMLDFSQENQEKYRTNGYADAARVLESTMVLPIVQGALNVELVLAMMDRDQPDEARRLADNANPVVSDNFSVIAMAQAESYSRQGGFFEAIGLKEDTKRAYPMNANNMWAYEKADLIIEAQIMGKPYRKRSW